jgi:hypothetical protein
VAEKQTQVDSMMEVVCNITLGFLVSWAVLDWIVSPIYGWHTTAGTAFGVTAIFTVTSIIRQYLLRRAFNGRSVWQALKGVRA